MGNNKTSILPLEKITRYIFQKRHYAPGSKRVKYGAFLPRGGEVSVYRTSTISEAGIWDIGQKHVAAKRQQSLKARGDLVASSVFESSLSIEPEMRDHPLHANILGWSEHEPKNKLIAIKLADNQASPAPFLIIAFLFKGDASWPPIPSLKKEQPSLKKRQKNKRNEKIHLSVYIHPANTPPNVYSLILSQH